MGFERAGEGREDPREKRTFECAHVREPNGKEALLKGKGYLVNMGSGICAGLSRVEPQGAGCLQVALRGKVELVRMRNEGREQSGKVRGK